MRILLLILLIGFGLYGCFLMVTIPMMMPRSEHVEQICADGMRLANDSTPMEVRRSFSISCTGFYEEIEVWNKKLSRNSQITMFSIWLLIIFVFNIRNVAKWYVKDDDEK